MSILQTVVPVTHDLGGFQVRRAIPSPQLRMVGPFVFVDQLGPARLEAGQGMDVRPHPHINLATVTWLFEGAIDHRDSLGTFSTIRPGDAMTLASERGGKVKLLGGEAFPTRRYVYWNFVSSRRERIEQAKEDWIARRFPLVPGDAEEFIPFPDKPKTVSYP